MEQTSSNKPSASAQKTLELEVLLENQNSFEEGSLQDKDHEKNTLIESNNVNNEITMEISANLLMLSESINVKGNLVERNSIQLPIGHIPIFLRKRPLMRMCDRYFKEYDNYSPLYRRTFSEYLEKINVNRLETYSNVCWVFCPIMNKW